MPITIIVRPDEGEPASGGDAGGATPQGAAAAPLRLTFDAPRVVIGRGQSCDVRLPDPSVSSRHASIHAKGAEYTIFDEGSMNGTFVGGVRVAPRTSRLLRSGELVRVGRVWLEARVDASPPTRDLPNATRDLALALVAHAMQRVGEDIIPKVRVVEGHDLGATLLLFDEGRGYLVGRGANCELPLADPDASREHVQITRRGAVVLVRDLGAKNGAWLGDTRLAPGRDTPWRPALVVRAGGTVLALEEPISSALAALEDSPDEPIPAPAEPAPAPIPTSSTVAPESSLPASSVPRSAAPLAQVGPGTPAPAPRKGGWTVADMIVLLVAILILGASIAGLVWLLRGT